MEPNIAGDNQGRLNDQQHEPRREGDPLTQEIGFSSRQRLGLGKPRLEEERAGKAEQECSQQHERHRDEEFPLAR